MPARPLSVCPSVRCRPCLARSLPNRCLSVAASAPSSPVSSAAPLSGRSGSRLLVAAAKEHGELSQNVARPPSLTEPNPSRGCGPGPKIHKMIVKRGAILGASIFLRAATMHAIRINGHSPCKADQADGRAGRGSSEREGGSPKGGGRRSRRPHRRARPPRRTAAPSRSNKRKNERAREGAREGARAPHPPPPLQPITRGLSPWPPSSPLRLPTWELCSVAAVARRGRSVGGRSRSVSVSSAMLKLNSWIGSLSAPKSAVVRRSSLHEERSVSNSTAAWSSPVGPPNLLLSSCLAPGENACARNALLYSLPHARALPTSQSGRPTQPKRPRPNLRLMRCYLL